jgi:hypothetical protein
MERHNLRPSEAGRWHAARHLHAEVTASSPSGGGLSHSLPITLTEQ